MLKDDVALFLWLYIVAKHRDYDFFFKHENQYYPPSLFDYDKLQFADLLHIFTQESQQDPFDAIAYNGAALVHLFPKTKLPHLMSM